MSSGKYLSAVQTILKDFPFYAPVIDNARFVEDPNIDTASCSHDLEIRYNPVFFDRLKPRELVFVVLHEFLHFLNHHHVRALTMNALTLSTNYLKNIAMDLEINSFISTKLKYKPLTEGVFPKNFGYPENLTAEEYLGLLHGTLIRLHVSEIGNSKFEKEALIKLYGSCITGLDIDTESLEDNETELSDSTFYDEICEEVDESIKDYDPTGGCGTSKFRKVKPPTKTYNWKELIKRLISHSASAKLSGASRLTYSRPSRRHYDDDIIFPTYYDETMEVKLLLMMDISGSMHEASVRMLGYIRNLIHTIERSDNYKITVKVLFADDKVYKNKVYDVQSIDNITEIPDGGANSAEWLEFVRDYPEKFDTILIWTDCITPWIKIPGNITVITFSDVKSLPSQFVPPYKTFTIKE